VAEDHADPVLQDLAAAEVMLEEAVILEVVILEVVAEVAAVLE
jgi:hypothetical protein